MLKLYTERQKVLIINNVIKACKDINQLNSTGYKFLYLSNGFIGHYDLNGFISCYRNHSLMNDIMEFQSFNQWNNFKENDPYYSYYMDKKDIYNKIVIALNSSK